MKLYPDKAKPSAKTVLSGKRLGNMRSETKEMIDSATRINPEDYRSLLVENSKIQGEKEKKMKRFVMYISFALLLLFSGGEIQALTIIDTTPAWTGSGVGIFGYPNFATFGQVITVPAKDRALESFTFYMNLPATCTFRGFVYACVSRAKESWGQATETRY
jgi:hypothetical protein